jgi:hypothetical protein
MSPENLSRRAILAGADLKVVGGKADSPPVTIEQIAAIEFKPVKEFARLSEAKRDERLREMSTTVYQLAGFAMEIHTKRKDELVKVVREQYADLGSWLMTFHNAANDAKALAELIEGAEVRLLWALAVVESEPPPDDGGGGGDDDGEPVPESAAA